MVPPLVPIVLASALAAAGGAAPKEPQSPDAQRPQSPAVQEPPAPAAQEPPAAAAQDAAPQRATAADMKIMAPYIGTFRSATQQFDDGKTEYHFTVTYDWFDRAQTIVRFRVAMVIPSQQRTLVQAEGFYGFDPFADRIYVFGAFSHGISGWGSFCSFDHATGKRTVCARSQDGNGVVTHVRDSFEVVDTDNWRNRTWARAGDSGEWKLIHDGAYQRVR